MASVNVKRRNVCNLLGLAVAVGVLYIITILMAAVVKKSVNVIDSAPSDLPVSIKSVLPSGNGQLDLTLSINIDDIIKHLEGYKHANGEATSNPVPRNTSFVKNVPNICKDAPNLKYIVYVHTSPTNEKRRGNVRKTWGNVNLFKDGRVRLIFLAGIPQNKNDQDILDKEHEQFKDIVQGDFMDEYRNLTLKGLMGLKWVAEFCPNAKYVIKADDDAFVNIFELLNVIDDEKSPRMMLCPLWKANSMPILRDPAKCMKWCVKYSEFPGLNYFPMYCAGLAYVMSRDIAEEMHAKSYSTPFFWIDDVYITGVLLGKVSNVKYVDVMKNFTLKEKLAAEDYLSEAPHTKYMIAHVKTEEKWDSMWKASLHRVTDKQLMTLSEDVIGQNSHLKQRWEKMQKT